MIHILLASYGFRGAMLIVGGWTLHSVVGACLLRPVEVTDTKEIKKVINELILRLNLHILKKVFVQLAKIYLALYKLEEGINFYRFYDAFA